MGRWGSGRDEGRGALGRPQPEQCQGSGGKEKIPGDCRCGVRGAMDRQGPAMGLGFVADARGFLFSVVPSPRVPADGLQGAAARRFSMVPRAPPRGPAPSSQTFRPVTPASPPGSLGWLSLQGSLAGKEAVRRAKSC